MPRPPKAKEPLKQAALQLFVDQGVHATGIREIAKHAGCSEAALYRHWQNKDRLVNDLFREHLSEVVELIDSAPAEITGKERIHLLVEKLCLLYDDKQLVFRFVLLVQHELARQLPDDLRMPQDAIQEVVAGQMECAVDDVNAVQVTAAIIGMFLETAAYVLYGRLPGPFVTYTDAIAERCWTLMKTSTTSA